MEGHNARLPYLNKVPSALYVEDTTLEVSNMVWLTNDVCDPRPPASITSMFERGVPLTQASITTLRTRFPSSSEVRLASSKAPLALLSPLKRWVTMSSRLGSVNPAPVTPFL